MPTPVHKAVSGRSALTSSTKTVQAFLGRTVVQQVDHQMQAAEIIKLQQYLVTQGKFSAGNVNKSIDNEHLERKMIEVQIAANLP